MRTMYCLPVLRPLPCKLSGPIVVILVPGITIERMSVPAMDRWYIHCHPERVSNKAMINDDNANVFLERGKDGSRREDGREVMTEMPRKPAPSRVEHETLRTLLPYQTLSFHSDTK